MQRGPHMTQAASEVCESSWRMQRPTLESDFSSTESRTKRDADASWLITATAWQLKSITSCGGVSWRKLAQRENELESVCCHEASVCGQFHGVAQLRCEKAPQSC